MRAATAQGSEAHDLFAKTSTQIGAVQRETGEA